MQHKLTVRTSNYLFGAGSEDWWEPEEVELTPSKPDDKRAHKSVTIVYDPLDSGCFKKGAKMSLCELNFTLELGYFSNGTLIKHKGRYYRIRFTDELNQNNLFKQEKVPYKMEV